MQVVSVSIRYEDHFAFGGMSMGTFRVKVLKAYRGLHPMESMAIDYDWNWTDDREAEGFLPQAGHVYLYDSFDPMDGNWVDLDAAACTPSPPAS